MSKIKNISNKEAGKSTEPLIQRKTKVKDIGEINTMSETNFLVSGLQPGKFFALPEFKTELEVIGNKCSVNYKIRTSGKELKEICDQFNLNPDNPGEFITMCDIVVFKDILDAIKHRMETVKRNVERVKHEQQTRLRQI